MAGLFYSTFVQLCPESLKQEHGVGGNQLQVNQLWNLSEVVYLSLIKQKAS